MSPPGDMICYFCQLSPYRLTPAPPTYYHRGEYSMNDLYLEGSVPGAKLLSVRISDDLNDGLMKMVKATGRTKSFLTNEALRQFLKHQAWRIKVNPGVEQEEVTDPSE